MESSLLTEQCSNCKDNLPPLTATDINNYISQLGPDWCCQNDALIKPYMFPDYSQALLFVNYISKIAEDKNHHPDILLTWGKVIVTLKTHSQQHITKNDFIIAAHCDRAIEQTQVSIQVTGNVQGVFYRKCTAEQANYLKLNGYVKNNPDGSVSIDAQGPIYTCDGLIQWCYMGSSQSSVKSVSATYRSIERSIEGFNII